MAWILRQQDYHVLSAGPDLRRIALARSLVISKEINMTIGAVARDEPQKTESTTEDCSAIRNDLNSSQGIRMHISLK